MTAKEKVEELFYVFMEIQESTDPVDVAKKCVISVIAEILDSERLELSKMDRGFWEQAMNQALHLDILRLQHKPEHFNQ